MVLIITLAVFITVALLSWALMTYFVGGKTDVQERLDKLSPQVDITTDRRGTSSQFSKTLGTLGEKMPLSPKEHSKYARMLVAAGFRKDHVYPFMGSKIILTILLPLLYPVYLVFTTIHGETFREALFKSQPLLVTIALAIIRLSPAELLAVLHEKQAANPDLSYPAGYS